MDAERRFIGLYDAHYASVYAYCRRRAHPDQAEDACAEVFLTAWRRIDAVPDGDPGLHWLYGVAHRVLAHHWRSLGRRARLDRKLSALGAEAQDLVDHQLVVREEVRQVMEAASRLAPGELEVLTLAVWEGLTQAAIADVLGISEGAVKQRTHRARNKLIREVERLQTRRARTVAREGGGSSWYQKTG